MHSVVGDAHDGERRKKRNESQAGYSPGDRKTVGTATTVFVDTDDGERQQERNARRAAHIRGKESGPSSAPTLPGSVEPTRRRGHH